MKGFKVSLRGVVYGLEWVTVSLPVLYRGGVAQGGEAGAQGPPPARVGRERRALDPGVGSGVVRLWMCELVSFIHDLGKTSTITLAT